MRHLPSHHVEYWTRAKWICEGDLHEHLSREAALKCERRGGAARDTHGWTRAERADKAERKAAPPHRRRGGGGEK